MSAAHSQFTHLRPSQLDSFAVEVSAEERVEGDPRIEVWIVHNSDDRKSAVGLFEVTAGRLTTTIFGDELVCLVAGELVLHRPGEEPLAVEPGDYWFLPDGTSLDYEAKTKIRCQFWVTASEPLPYL